jgi:ribonuclease HII
VILHDTSIAQIRYYIKQLFPKGCFISSSQDSRCAILKDIIQHLYKDKRKGARDLCNFAQRLMETQIEMAKHLQEMLFYEKDLSKKGYTLIGGLDEVGRGPLAGPVVAGCVILDPDVPIPGVDDSKKLSALQRQSLYFEIKEKALAISIGIVDNETIDRVNILQASLEAMCRAVKEIPIKPDYLLIDGQFCPQLDFSMQTITAGDSKSLSIAAASIIAKVTRDKIMDELDEIYPQYGFSRNKGYPTHEHVSALKKHGPCEIHRKTFAPVIAATAQLRIRD